MWGGRADRNMVSAETSLPDSFEPGIGRSGASTQPARRNVKWAVPLGSRTYSTPTVAAGRVFIGTNNGHPRDPKYGGDYGILLCLNESDGRLLWQLAAPAGQYANLGICSPATIEGNRVYVVTGRAEVLCLDINGLADGNDGPFTEELKHLSQPPRGRKPTTAPVTEPADEPFRLGPTDADIIWRYDMAAELKVFAHDTANSSVLIVGETLFVGTSNGVDNPKQRRANSTVPSLIALDRKTGRLLAADGECIGRRMYHGGWCSPSLGVVAGQPVIFFGGADGVLYAFDGRIEQARPSTQPAAPNAPVLRRLWAFDCNPPEYLQRDGQPIAYRAKEDGPNEVIATPVVHKGLVYVAIGQDPDHGTGRGCLWCLDPGRLDENGLPTVVWANKQVDRSVSTVSIADGLLYIGDRRGDVHCLDAETGKLLWTHQTGSVVWCSTLVADGKVYVGTRNGRLFVLAAGRQMKLLSRIDLRFPIYATPVAANGVLYVATDTTLYAVQAGR